MEERWFSVDEIATYLGVSRETVYRWIDAKGLPAHRIGKFWRFKTSEVDAWAKADQAQGQPRMPEESGSNAPNRVVSAKRPR